MILPPDLVLVSEDSNLPTEELQCEICEETLILGTCKMGPIHGITISCPECKKQFVYLPRKMTIKAGKIRGGRRGHYWQPPR